MEEGKKKIGGIRLHFGDGKKKEQTGYGRKKSDRKLKHDTR